MYQIKEIKWDLPRLLIHLLKTKQCLAAWPFSGHTGSHPAQTTSAASCGRQPNNKRLAAVALGDKEPVCGEAAPGAAHLPVDPRVWVCGLVQATRSTMRKLGYKRVKGKKRWQDCQRQQGGPSSHPFPLAKQFCRWVFKGIFFASESVCV